jgi:hypothetical protein
MATGVAIKLCRLANIYKARSASSQLLRLGYEYTPVYPNLTGLGLQNHLHPLVLAIMVETSELLRYEDDYKDLHPAPHEFFHCELASALQEQMFGISDALITNSGGFGATAVVEVLEGDKYAVVLTRQGFEVRCLEKLSNTF